jgi:hypothetical protein
MKLFVGGLVLLASGLALQVVDRTVGGVLAVIGGFAFIAGVIASFIDPDGDSKRPSLLASFPANLFVAGLVLLAAGLFLQVVTWTAGGVLAAIGGVAMIVAMVAWLI